MNIAYWGADDATALSEWLDTAFQKFADVFRSYSKAK